MAKHPYSRAFPRKPNSRSYLLRDIPAGLRRAAQAKAKREHIALRTVLLRQLHLWTYGTDTDLLVLDPRQNREAT
jgi:hypothetical protein